MLDLLVEAIPWVPAGLENQEVLAVAHLGNARSAKKSSNVEMANIRKIRT